MDNKARFYDLILKRWSQPDSIIPDQFNPQAWNRYAYTLNNPIRYNDPTGHMCSDPEDPSPTCDGSGTTRVGDRMIIGEHVSDGESSFFETRDNSRPEIPIDPTQQQFVDDPPPPVSTTRLVVGTIIFGVTLVIGVALTAIGIGASFEDPFALTLAAFGGTVVVFSIEGLYQIWRPLLRETAPANLIIPGFKIP